MAATIEFTCQNIRLPDGTFTKPEMGWTMDVNPWFLSARKVLDLVFPGDKSRYRIADLGCLEGGFTAEFAKLGFQSTGIEVRESNMVACRYVHEKMGLDNLNYIKDDAWNVAEHGPFDAMFCSGLLYHLDRPKKFLEILSEVTSRVLILQTHFAVEGTEDINAHHLSDMCENEGLRGRWFTEFGSSDDFENRENLKYYAWDNHRSFWVQREYLLQTIRDVGFDIVLEQFDGLGWPDGEIVHSMTKGWYKSNSRGTFVGIKSKG